MSSGSLLEQIHSRKNQMKLNWKEIAELVHKDVSTVRKQLSIAGNPSISILEEYLSAMDCTVILVPNGERNETILSEDQAAEIAHLLEKVSSLESENEEYKHTIKRLREQYDRLAQLVSMKDSKVERLNERLYEINTMLLEMERSHEMQIV